MNTISKMWKLLLSIAESILTYVEFADTYMISRVAGEVWFNVAKDEPALVAVITARYTGVERVGLNKFATSILDDGLQRKDILYLSTRFHTG